MRSYLDGTEVALLNNVLAAVKLEGNRFRIRMTPQEDRCVGILEVQVALEE